MLLGFDIGGTKCAVLIGDKTADDIQILCKESMPTDLPVYDMIEKLFVTAERLLAQFNIGITKVEGIGISCGGPLSSKRGLILSPPNLLGWDNVPIVKMASERFGRPVLLQNDANACAVAEWRYGAGKGYNNLIFLTFGTGMGAGLILNGQLYSGISDLAGEVGHIRLAEMGPVGFGKAGSFEGFCSGGGIAQIGQIKAREMLQVGKSVAYCNSIEELTQLTAKSIAEAAFAGDETALAVYQLCGQYLGKALALFIDMLNPELIILGSIFGRSEELLRPAMMESINQEAYFESIAACKIVPAGLSENVGDMAALSLATMSNQTAFQ
ncbi:ROK family protein [Mucilaginibacter agri]|uniref:ROK family protein n=1 Tax=Mucilaginibacter agri TaxID=2695265 RepID=A0A965ZIH5_9SPHI|nr:ROK family protein [Mucilaginibacter agri]NCD71719.1 ROK family protein [Mucilaginibacter agri]